VQCAAGAQTKYLHALRLFADKMFLSFDFNRYFVGIVQGLTHNISASCPRPIQQMNGATGEPYLRQY